VERIFMGHGSTPNTFILSEKFNDCLLMMVYLFAEIIFVRNKCTYHYRESKSTRPPPTCPPFQPTRTPFRDNSPPLWSVVDWLGNYQVPYTRMSEGCRWECNRDSFLYFYSITGADLIQIGLSVYVWILAVIINDLRKLLPQCMFLM